MSLVIKTNRKKMRDSFVSTTIKVKKTPTSVVHRRLKECMKIDKIVEHIVYRLYRKIRDLSEGLFY